MVLGRSSVVEKPKRTCTCTFDHRDLQCKQHGG